MQFLQYQSMLNSTKNHKSFSENDKNINETEKLINWLRRFVFFLSGWLWSYLLASPRPKDEHKKKFANHESEVGNHVYRSYA